MPDNRTTAFTHEGDSEFFVTCSECGLRRSDQIAYENIVEEVASGAAMLTFECKGCNKVRKSIMYS